jgi:hypothetical protein
MAINPMKPNQGGSTALKVGLGALTGGLGGAGMALLSSKNPQIGGPLQALAKTEVPVAKPEDDSSAIDRRLDDVSEDPAMIIDGGIDAINHPDVPQHVRDAAAPVLFATKHYAMKGLEVPDRHFDYLYQGQENG